MSYYKTNEMHKCYIMLLHTKRMLKRRVKTLAMKWLSCKIENKTTSDLRFKSKFEE